MTRTATQGLVMIGAFVALLVVAAAGFVKFDSDGLWGTAVGAGLGLVNLAVGSLATRRALRMKMQSAVATVAGGFIIRLFALVVLMVVFQRTHAVDPAAFALTFLVFFFVYLGVELLMVERSLSPTRKAG
jgi:ATP synthase I chain